MASGGEDLSDETVDFLCNTCQDNNNINNRAVDYCRTCREYFCERCLDGHNGKFPWKDHKDTLLGKDNLHNMSKTRQRAIGGNITTGRTSQQGIFEENTENFCRLAVLIMNGCTHIMCFLFLRHVKSSTPAGHPHSHWTVDEFLLAHKSDICEKLGKEKGMLPGIKENILFPSHGATDLGKWDIVLLSFILLDVCNYKVQQPLAMYLNKIKKVRNSICHRGDASVTNNDFNQHFDQIKTCIEGCCNFLADKAIKDDMCNLVHNVEHSTFSLDDSTRLLKEWHDSDKQIGKLLQQHSIALQAVDAKVETIGADVQTTGADVKKVGADVKTMGADVQTVGADVVTILSKVNVIYDILSKSGRNIDIALQAVDAKVETIVADVQTTGADVKKVGADVKTMGADVKTMGADVQTMGADVQTTGADVKTVGADVKTMGADVQTMGADVQTMGADVQTMGADVQTMGADVKTMGADGQTMGADVQTTGADVKTVGADVKTMGADVQTMGADVQTMGADVQTIGAGVKIVGADVQTMEPKIDSGEIRPVSRREIMAERRDSIDDSNFDWPGVDASMTSTGGIAAEVQPQQNPDETNVRLVAVQQSPSSDQSKQKEYKRQVQSWCDVRPGMFCVVKNISYVLGHAVLITGRDAERNVVTAVHYGCPGGLLARRTVVEEEFTVDLAKKELWEVVIPEAERVSPEVAVQNAKSKRREQKFNVFTRRSSHVVRECLKK